MSESEIVVSSFAQFHDWVRHYRTKAAFFRGVPDISFELVPSLGRCLPRFESRGEDKATLLRFEKHALSIFAREASAFADAKWSNKLELIALAQHHGLPTRVLDWTLNPLTALYFAVESTASTDSALYAVRGITWVDHDEADDVDPMALTEVIAFGPAHTSPRIRAQAAILTIHPDPTVPFRHNELTRVRIPVAARKEMRATLFHFGITQKSVFPDLSGLAAWIRELKFGRDVPV